MATARELTTVRVRCSYCCEDHAVPIGGWIVCPQSLEYVSSQNYLFARNRMTVTQTSKFENLAPYIRLRTGFS